MPKRALRRGDGTSRTPSPYRSRSKACTPCRGRRPRRPAAGTLGSAPGIRGAMRASRPTQDFGLSAISSLPRRAGCPQPAAGTLGSAPGIRGAMRASRPTQRPTFRATTVLVHELWEPTKSPGTDYCGARVNNFYNSTMVLSSISALPSLTVSVPPRAFG